MGNKKQKNRSIKKGSGFLPIYTVICCFLYELFYYVLPYLYTVLKGVDIIGKIPPVQDGIYTDEDVEIEHITPVLSESEKIRIKSEVNKGLYNIFKKYFKYD